jgi:hypothetical protein
MDEWLSQAEAWAGQAERWIRQQPPEQIYVAVAVIALTILVLVAGDAPNLTSSLQRVLAPKSLRRCWVRFHVTRAALYSRTRADWVLK